MVVDPPKVCKACGATFTRTRYGPGGRTLEDRTRYQRRENCSQACANSRAVVDKSAQHWRARKVRAATCQECGTTERLHVHHADRDHTNNDPSNLVTMCASHHIKLHWREDRENRMAAVWRGVRTKQRSAAGKPS